MPYKSDSQRRWAHTDKGEKALGGPEGVNEWDQASKGKKLPEKVHKMAEGGIVEDKTWKDKLKDYMLSNFGKPTHEMGSNLEGFHNLLTRNSDIANSIDPVVQPSSGTTQGYAQGGVIGQDPDFINQLASGTVPGLQFNPNAGLPPTPPPQMPPVAPPMPVQAPIAPNPINNYLDQQKAQLNKYGPEQQLALSQNLLKQRQSVPQIAGRALGTMGDAIMQGVARAGSGGFADRIQGQQDAVAKQQMESLEKAGTQNIARTEANMKLDAQDPRSALSKVAQQTWGTLLAKNGFKPEQIANMPASSIAALTGQTVEALKAKAEAEMARASLGLKTQEAAQTKAHQTAEEGIAKGNLEAKTEEDRRKNLHDLTSPVNALLHPINAWNASKELNSIANTDKSITATNPKTGHKIISTDGGKTWTEQ